MLNILRLEYWVSAQALPFLPAVEWTLLGLMFLFILVGEYVYFFLRRKEQNKDKRLAWRRLGTAMVWAGVCGLLLWALVWQQIPYLSSRFFWVIWLVSFGLWFRSIWIYLRKEIPAKQAKHAEQEAAQKWIPKPKK